MADCFVAIIIKDKLLFTRNREKGEHVTTGERSDESFFRIDIRRIAQISRAQRRPSCRGRHQSSRYDRADISDNRIGAAPRLQDEGDFMFGHAFSIGCIPNLASSLPLGQKTGLGAEFYSNLERFLRCKAADCDECRPGVP